MGFKKLCNNINFILFFQFKNHLIIVNLIIDFQKLKTLPSNLSFSTMFENQTKMNIFDAINIESLLENKFIEKNYDFLQNNFKLPRDIKSKILKITHPFTFPNQMRREDIIKMKKQLCVHFNEEEARSILILFRLRSNYHIF